MGDEEQWMYQGTNPNGPNIGKFLEAAAQTYLPIEQGLTTPGNDLVGQTPGFLDGLNIHGPIELGLMTQGSALLGRKQGLLAESVCRT